MHLYFSDFPGGNCVAVRFTKLINQPTIHKHMEQAVILIERKGKGQFIRFIEMFKNRTEIPMKEIRAKIARSSFYELILGRIYELNQTLSRLSPDLEPFIAPTLQNLNGKIIQSFRRNCNIEIVDEDPNYFYLRVKTTERQLEEELAR